MHILRRVNFHGVAAIVATTWLWRAWMARFHRDLHAGWIFAAVSVIYAAIVIANGARTVGEPDAEKANRERLSRNAASVGAHLFFMIAMSFLWARLPNPGDDYAIFSILVSLIIGMTMPFMSVIRDESPPPTI